MSVSPTTRAAGVLALISLTALVVPLPVTGLAIIALLTATTTDALRARAKPKVDVSIPTILSRGVPAPLEVAVDARSDVRVRQPSPPEVLVEPSEGDEGLAARVTGLTRGRHVLPRPAMRTLGPLGLVHGWHHGARDHEVLVYPNLHAARKLVVAVRRGRFGSAGRSAGGPLGLGTDFESIRDYLPDDDFRQVNWQATSRLGRAMSNQYRIERDQEIICLVDCGRLMSAPLNDRTRLDEALDAMTAVALVADEIGDRCGAVAFESTLARSVKPRRRGGQRVIRALFDLEPAVGDSDYELAFRTVGRGGKRALILILTDLVDEAAAQALIRAVPVLSRHHAVIVASARDADLGALLAGAPETHQDVYAMSVALQMLEERARVAARIRHVGADVLEASPGRLGAACVRAYLKTKQRARL
jgi:uncharacterized protein (DUF58 family)